MQLGVSIILSIVIWAAAYCRAVYGEDLAPSAPPKDSGGAVERKPRRIGPDLYALGTLTIDAKQGSIRCPGRVNMASGGPIELLACLPTGKVHESVLTLDVEPLDLQVALLLLNLEPGRNPAVKYPEGAPELSQKPGDTVDIRVEWQEPVAGGEGTRTVSRRADELLYNVVAKKPMPQTRWAFIGSKWAGKRFGAGIEGSLIVTYHDPLGILELSLEEVNDDIWYVVNDKAVPPVGTKVELVIQRPPAKDKGPEKAGQE